MTGLEHTQAAGIPAFLRNTLDISASESGEIRLSRPDGSAISLTSHEADRLRRFMNTIVLGQKG